MPATPVSAANFKGKTVWDIQYLAASPTVAAHSTGFREAGQAIGVGTRLYDGKGTPSGYSDGINQAVAQGAAAIVLDGIDPELVSGALENAASKHIPAVDVNGTSPTAPYPTGLISHFDIDQDVLGAAQVDYALAKSGCRAGILQTTIRGIKGNDALVASAKAELAALCNSCHLYSTKTDPTALATKLSGQVEAELQKHPDIGYVMTGSDSMVQYVENGVRTVGKNDIGIIGISGTNLPNMKDGQLPYEVADLAVMPNDTFGWFSMYIALQAASGQRTSLAVAYHTVDASNLQDPVEVPNFKETFLRLFGVSS
jgi:ribose transport system substrate-binding protein